jgi:hypothetical protein
MEAPFVVPGNLALQALEIFPRLRAVRPDFLTFDRSQYSAADHIHASPSLQKFGVIQEQHENAFTALAVRSGQVVPDRVEVVVSLRCHQFLGCARAGDFPCL